MTTEGSGPDLGALLSQVGQLQQNILAAQAEAASQVVEGRSGGGAVRVELSGSMEAVSVTIDPDVVDPADVETLQDLVLAAVRDAVEQVNNLQSAAMGDLGDLGGGLPGLLGG